MNEMTEMALSGVCSVISLGVELGDATAERVLSLYCGIYDVPEGDAGKLNECLHDERVVGLRSDTDYYAVLRANKYLEAVGECRAPGLVDKVIERKGKAAIGWRNCGWRFRSDLSRSEAVTEMGDMAERGYIHALTAVGVMMCEGIFLPEKPDEGLSMLLRAAKWNDVEAMFLALRYVGDKAEKEDILSRLCTVLKMQFKDELLAETIEKYGPPERDRSPEAEILEKMFGRGIVNREVYSRAHARVLYSPALSVADKKRMLFSGDRSRISELAQLPVKLDAAGKCGLNEDALCRAAVLCEHAHAEIAAALSGYACARIGEKPLCISSASKYIRKALGAAIGRALGGANFIKVSVASSEESAFDRTRYNVFLRGYDENRPNIVLIELCGELSENKIRRVVEFLDRDKRSAFALHDLGVTLDVGALMPLCICDKPNEAALRKVCNMVRIGEPSRERRGEIVRTIAAEAGETYGYAKVTLSQDAVRELSALTLDEAAAKIETVTQKNVRGGEMTIDGGMLNKVGEIRPGYGFGGYGYENR